MTIFISLTLFARVGIIPMLSTENVRLQSLKADIIYQAKNC